MQTQATAQKCPKTPMGRTGIVGLRLSIMWLRVFFTLHSAKTLARGVCFSMRMNSEVLAEVLVRAFFHVYYDNNYLGIKIFFSDN
ncbi:hypothetical protein HBP72_09215 [Listeria welshimeri]|nr:hypothetical protein [Listeria welshimeri]MBC1370061.1 hypothetical protein [Listeria welshimeri]MBC2346524.1 hypothetical protein [Listeria welshimeri]MBC2358902.1 hypothetical protein [Listeria welshimeri]